MSMRFTLITPILLLLPQASLVRADSLIYPSETDPPALGLGYDPVSASILGRCIDRALTRRTNSGQDGRNSSISIRLLDDAHQLSEQTNVEASIGGKWGFGSASGSTSYSRSKKINSHDVYFHMRNRVEVSSEHIDNPTLTSEAMESYQNNPRQFYAKCGTEFIYSVSRGGLVDALMHISTKSTEDKKKVIATFGGSYLGAEGSASFRKKVEYLRKTSSIDFSLIRVGGTKPPTSLSPDAVLNFVLGFENEVKGHNGLLVAGTKKYQGSVFKYEPKVRDDARERWLRDSFQLFEEASTRMANVEFSLEHPDQFSNFDRDSASKKRADLAKYLTELETASRECSQLPIGSTCAEFQSQMPEAAQLHRYDVIREHKMKSALNVDMPSGLHCKLGEVNGHWYKWNGDKARDCSNLQVRMNATGSLASSNFDSHYSDNRGMCTFRFVCSVPPATQPNLELRK